MALLKEVQEQLTALSLNHSFRSLEKILETAQAEDWTILKTLHTLLLAERQARVDKAKEKRLKKCRFPLYGDDRRV